MKNVQVNRNRTNMGALDETLRAELGTIYTGMSRRKEAVIAHLTDTASLAEIARARQIITEHDDTVLSARQQAQQAKRQRLQNARQTYQQDIDLTEFMLTDPLVRKLAQKVHLLSLEIEAIRNEDD